MSTLHLVCAAGEGTRFHDLLGDRPKPLIRLEGRRLLDWAIRSLPIRSGDHVAVVVQRRHEVRRRFESLVLDPGTGPPLEWVELDAPTRGQLETALAAIEALVGGTGTDSRSLAIYNCDTFFESDTLAGMLEDESNAGVLPCSLEPGDSWSFCEVDDADRVLRIAEKKRVGPWATAGFYFFRDLETFVARAREAVATFDVVAASRTAASGSELYVAPLYQRYLDAGETIAIDRVRTFKPMGTPEQIERYWGVSEEALKAENA
ncbi:MAG: NTP transferase domain-containing protein [Phycisphaerales bacterium]|jgi:NDP-sugar pyrophosphorylase family protein|nr:NTP transferase domain-containing protein [Planctomycetota bacterium]